MPGECQAQARNGEENRTRAVHRRGWANTAGRAESYGHRVVRYSWAGAGEVLAYCRGVDLAIGSYEAACAKLPGARLAVRWGVFTPRKNFKD